MTGAASLSLLKGGKKESVADELDKGSIAADEEVVVVDVDSMSSEELDGFVKDNAFDVPGQWADWDVEAKREYLNNNFGDGAEAPAPEEKPAEEPKAAKHKAKGKKKGTSLVTSDVKEGEILGQDVLQDTIHEIENMSEDQARKAVTMLAEHAEGTYFKLGGVLSVIHSNGWFQPYGSFAEFVEKEHGLALRRAMYWIEIYNSLANSGVPWAKVKDLGWTKLKEIARVLTTDNVDEWVKIASESNTLTLIETVKNHISKKKTAELTDGTESKTVTTKTFKVHDDQKKTIEAAIDKAKKDGNTTVDTVALEYICLDYMNAQTLQDRLKKAGLDAAVDALEKAFPGATIEVNIE